MTREDAEREARDGFDEWCASMGDEDEIDRLRARLAEAEAEKKRALNRYEAAADRADAWRTRALDSERRLAEVEAALAEIREEANREHPERTSVGHIARVADAALRGADTA